MCKKLSIFCFVLAVVAVLSMSALADYPITSTNPLRVDIGGENTVHNKGTWVPWVFTRDWTGPVSTGEIDMGGLPGENPICSMTTYRKNQTPTNTGGSRARVGCMTFVAGTNEYNKTSKGFGMNYIKLTVSQLEPTKQYEFSMWSWEAKSTWSMDANNSNSKWVAWSTTNPKAWLDTHTGQYKGIISGFDPNGYGPKTVAIPPGTTDTNMPGSPANPYTGTGSSLYDLMAGRNSMSGDANDHLGEKGYCESTFRAMTDADGIIELYGWLDATDWTGSAHVPINGFIVIPEPTTVALLGLGGLALLRRKRA